MKKLFRASLLCAIAIFFCSWSQHAVNVISPPVTNTFIPLKTGGGGLIVGTDLSTTGVRFLRADVFGGYIWTANLANCGPQAVTGCWYDVINSTTMPAANYGVQPTTGTSQKFQSPSSNGVLEIAGAPSAATVAYMNYGNFVYVSTTIDTTTPSSIRWVKASESGSGWPQSVNDNSNDQPRRLGGRRMAVDPNNPDHVIVGTYGDGIWETKNGRAGAATTWTQISTGSIPLATNGYNIAFDPASGTSVCGSAVCTNKIYIFTNNGAGGLYVSVDAGATYAAAPAGGPTTAQALMVHPTSGVVWIVSGTPSASGTVWTYSGGAAGSWTSKLSGSGNCCHWVAINPANTNHVVVLGNNGAIRSSSDGGSSFTAELAFTRAAGDAPWTALANEAYMTAGAVEFDPLNNDLLIFGGGQAVYSTTFPTSSFVWTSISDGTEGSIGWNIAVPEANKPVIGQQDNGLFAYNTMDNRNLSTVYPGLAARTLTFGSGVANPPNDGGFLVAKISDNFNGTLDWSGYSTDRFATFMPFGTWGSQVPATSISNNGSGVVRVTTPDAASLTTWSAGTGSIVCSISTVTPSSNLIGGGACYTVNKISPTQFDLVGATYSAGMSTTGGSYIMWSPAPTQMSSWGGTLNVIDTANSGGKIRVSYMYRNFGLLANGEPVCFSSVLGTTEANGCWIAESVAGSGASGAVTLGPSSTFSNAYTGGGIGAKWREPGGYIAAASRTNIAMVAGNSSYPICTTDGGQSWTQMTYPSAIPPAQTTVVGGPYSAGTTVIQLASTSGLSAGSVVHIPMDDGRDYVNTLASVSSPNVTLSLAVPTGRSIPNGAALWTATGWGFAAYLATRQVAADYVQPNTFFAVNYPTGLYKWTGCGSPSGTLVQVAATGSWQSNGGFNSKIKTVPGESGHLFYTSGPVGASANNPTLNADHPAASGLWRACNGDSNSAVTWQQVSGFSEPTGFGFGRAKPGNSYPTIYVLGWYNGDYGLWKSTDDANHGNSGASASCTGGNTWTKMPTWPSYSALGFNDIEGDPFVYGQVYGSSGRGVFTGMFNFLLKRDMDPASNDNDPMWLEKAA